MCSGMEGRTKSLSGVLCFFCLPRSVEAQFRGRGIRNVRLPNPSSPLSYRLFCSPANTSHRQWVAWGGGRGCSRREGGAAWGKRGCSWKYCENKVFVCHAMPLYLYGDTKTIKNLSDATNFIAYGVPLIEYQLVSSLYWVQPSPLTVVNFVYLRVNLGSRQSIGQEQLSLTFQLTVSPH